MSGSSGTGGHEPPTLSCEDLEFDTQLTSPKLDVVTQLSKGSILKVSTQVTGGKSRVVATYKGAEAGGIGSSDLKQLRECIDGGTRYSATVLSINSGQVKVHVEAIKS
jgi:hypothetical protein